MTDALINAVHPTQVVEVLQKAGYRAHLAATPQGPQIQSAAQGIGFFIGFGNTVPGAQGQYADFSFHCWLGVEGVLPPALVETWNSSKRFARLFLVQKTLVLTMDVLVAGGVSERHLVAQAELWDRVLRELVAHLKTRPAGTPAPHSEEVAA